MGLKEIDWKRINLAYDRDNWRAFVNELTNIRFSKNTGNILICWQTGSYWRRTLLHGVSEL